MKRKSLFFTLFVFIFGLCGTLGYFNFQESFTNAESSTASVWDGKEFKDTDTVEDKDWYNEGERFYYIRSAKGFSYFSYLINKENGYQSFKDKTVTLEIDIDLNGHNFKPIGNATNVFQGTFNGKGHYIYNLKFDSTTNSNFDVRFVGLFGSLTDYSVIQNLHIRNLEINISDKAGLKNPSSNSKKAELYIGGMVGYFNNTAILDYNYNLSKLLNCSVKGKITTGFNYSYIYHVGGLAGCSQNVTFKNCMADVEINSTNSEKVELGQRVGGLSGSSIYTNYENCFNESNIQANTGAVGGIAGYATGLNAANPMKMSNVYNAGNIIVSDSTWLRVGGLMGLVGKSGDYACFDINCAYNAGNIGYTFKPDEKSYYLGGLFGLSETVNSLTSSIKNSFMVGNIGSYSTNSGFEYSAQSSKINYLYTISETSSIKVSNVYFNVDKKENNSSLREIVNLDELAKTADFYSNIRYWSELDCWNFDIWKFSSGINSGYPYLIQAFNSGNSNNDSDYSGLNNLRGKGTADDPFLIETAGDLGWVSFNYNSFLNTGNKLEKKYYSLQNNIDLSGKTWQPIGTSTMPFNGVFDGNDFFISGITCSLQEQFGYHGLFGVTENAVIKNLVVRDISFINGGSEDTGIKGSFVGLAKGSTYLINCSDSSNYDGLQTVGKKADGGALFAIYGKNNITLSGSIVESTLIMPNSGVEYGYDITVSGKGGNFYDSERKLYLGDYHIIIQDDGSVLQPSYTYQEQESGKNVTTVIDETFGKTFLPRLSTFYGEKDVLIRRGFKLAGYKYSSSEENNSVEVSNFGGEDEKYTIELSKYPVKGLYADWEVKGYSPNGNVDINSAVNVKVVYNSYEKANFETEIGTSIWNVAQQDDAKSGLVEGDVYVDYYFEYDSFLYDYPELFETPISNGEEMRDGNFQINALYKSRVLNKSDFKQDDKLDSNDLINDNLSKILYAEWKGKEVLQDNGTYDVAIHNFKITFQKSEKEFFNDFNLKDSLNGIAIIKKYAENKEEKETISFDSLEENSNGTLSASFEYDTRLSDKTSNNFMFNLDICRGYTFSTSATIENKNDSNFGKIFIQGASRNKTDEHDGYAFEQSQINSAQFINLVGDYEIVITLQRETYENEVNVGNGVIFGIAPNVVSDSGTNYTEVSVKAQNGQFLSLYSAVQKQMQGLIGYDAFNNQLLSASESFDATILEDKYILKDFDIPSNIAGENLEDVSFVCLRYRFNDSPYRYFTYVTYKTKADSKPAVSLYEMDESGKNFAKFLVTIVKNDEIQAKMTYMADSTFSFLFSTEMTDLIFSRKDVEGNVYGNQKTYGKDKVPDDKRGEIVLVNPITTIKIAGEGGQEREDWVKFSIDFKDIFSDKDKKFSVYASTTFTKALIKFKTVYRNQDNEEIVLSQNQPLVDAKSTLYATNVDGIIQFDVKSTDYFEFDGNGIAHKQDNKNSLNLKLFNEQNFNIKIEGSEINGDDENTYKDAFNGNNRNYLEGTINYYAKGEEVEENPLDQRISDYDFYRIKLEYKADTNTSGLKAGLYEIFLYCTDVLYSIDFSTKFLTYDNVKNEQTGENNFTNQEHSEIVYNLTVNSNPYLKNGEIKFGDKISGETYLGSNKAYAFYDWYIKAENYGGYLGDTSKKLSEFLFSERYRKVNNSNSLFTDRYEMKLYAVYVRKEMNIKVSNQVALVDPNGQTGETMYSSYALGLDIKMGWKNETDSFKPVSADQCATFEYDSDIIGENTQLFNLSLKNGGLQSQAYYIYGYRLVDKDFEPIAAVNETDNLAQNIDLYTSLVTGDGVAQEKGEMTKEEISSWTNLSRTYYLLPMVKQKSATIYFHSGTGQEPYEGNVNGYVFNSNGKETTNDVLRMEKIYLGSVLLLNSRNEGYLNDNTELMPINIDNWFASRTGYSLPANGYWKNQEFGTSLHGSQIDLTYEFFARSGDNISQELHFYRIWNANNYVITFRPNGGEFTTVSSDYISIKVTYDSAGMTGNLPHRNTVTKVGYDFVGWSLNEDGTEQIFDQDLTLVPETHSNALFENGIYNKVAGDSTVYAMWEARTYKVEIKFNSANAVNGEEIPVEQQATFGTLYDIKYDSTFTHLVRDGVTKKISEISPVRMGYIFNGIYAVSGNYKTLITDTTVFDRSILSCNLNTEPALTLFVDWVFDSSFLSLKLNETSLPNLTYNASEQTVNISNYFAAGNFVSSGYNISTLEGKLMITIPTEMSSSVVMSIVSATAIIDNPSEMMFKVKNSGEYVVELSVAVIDNAIYMNQGNVSNLTLNLKIAVDKANVEMNMGDNTKLQNVKRIMSPLISSELKSKISSCSSFDQFVGIIKAGDASAVESANIDIYNYIMVKYYKMLTNNSATYNIYKQWKYADFAAYLQENQKEVELILTNTNFFDFYDASNETQMKEIQGYNDVAIISEQVSDVSTELSIKNIVLYLGYDNLMPNNIYEVRIYIENTNESLDKLVNYNVLYDSDKKAYISCGIGYLLPQILTVENKATTKTVYYSSEYTRRDVEWQGNRVSIDFNGKTYYHLDNGLLLSANIYTSNIGQASVDTDFSYLYEDNYLYFSDVSIIKQETTSGVSSYVDISTRFKLVMSESDLFTILNTNGVANVILSAKYLTKISGVLSFDPVADDLASNLLKITTVYYNIDGTEKNAYNADGLVEGSFSDNGVVIYEIKQNNENEVSLFITDAVTQIVFTTSTNALNESINLYKWSDQPIYNVDGTMEKQGSFTLNKDDIDINEVGLTEFYYYAIYTDLVLVNYNLNLPSSYPSISSTSTVLKLNESTLNDLTVPNEYGLNLASMKVKRPNGETLDYTSIFNGEDFGNGKVFAGLDASAKFTPITIDVKWALADIEYEQNLVAKKTAVLSFEKLTLEEIVSLFNINDNIYGYEYKWLFNGEVIATGDILTLKEKGSFNESGDYTLTVTAKINSKFIDSLEDPLITQKTIELNFTLEFVKNLISAIHVPTAEELQTTYDNREHIQDWFVSIDFFVYDSERDDYTEEATTQRLYYVTTGSIYFKVFFNGNEVSTMRNAGQYRILIFFDEAIYNLNASISENDKEFVYTIKSFSVDLSTYDFNGSKAFNSVEPSLNRDVYLTNENATLALTREVGEDIGTYELYFSDILKDYKQNYIFKYGDITLFENGVLTEAGKTTSIGTFTINASGTLRFSYQVSASSPKSISAPYCKDGYSIKLTQDLKLQILSNGTVFKEFSLQMYDATNGSNITSAEILNIIKSKVNDLTPKFYDTSPLDMAYDSASYSYVFELGNLFLQYYSNVEFENGYSFNISKITIDVSKIDFDKVYDGKTIVNMDLNGSEITDLEGFSGIYITGVYSSTHVGKNVRVELNYLAQNTSEKIGNYTLSTNVVSAEITKLKATMTINLNKTEFTYGEVSINNLSGIVSGFEIVGEDGQSKNDLLVSGFYEISYNLPRTVKTNERGFVYKGTYKLEAQGAFQDFDMTLILPDFDIVPMNYQKTISESSIVVFVSEQIKASYDESVTVSETGDVLTLKYFPQGLVVGQNPSAGIYELTLLNNPFLEGSIIANINQNNKGFEVLVATNILYIRLDNASIFEYIYSGLNHVLVADAENKKVSVIVGDTTYESTISFFTKDDSGVETPISSDAVTLTSLSIFNGTDATSFKSAGTYRLSLNAVSDEYANIMFENEQYFNIDKLTIDVSQFFFEKNYDGDTSYNVDNFNEKIVSDIVSVLVRFENSNAGENKNVSLYLNGIDSGNYKLSASSATGKINKANATVELTSSVVYFGTITNRNEIAFTVKANGMTLLSSQYSVALEVENPSYSILNYLEVGNYNVVMTNAVSTNYEINFVPTSISIKPYELNVNLTASGGYRAEFGTAEALANTFDYSYLSPLYEEVVLTLTRLEGSEVGDYKVLSGLSKNKNYIVANLEDTSETGFFRITTSNEKLYLLYSNEETLDGSKSGTEMTIEYDGNLYDTVAVEERGLGLYRLVLKNSTNTGVLMQFDLNFYTYNAEINTYTKVNTIVEGLSSNVRFLNPTMVKDVGTYEMYANSTQSPNYEVRMGKANEQYCFTLHIEKRQLYFKDAVLTKSFDNKNAEFIYENASEILNNCVDGEILGLNIQFTQNGDIVKYAGVNYDVVATLFGDSLDNYNLNLSTSAGVAVKANINRAEMTFIANDQSFVYGSEIDIEYQYTTEVDLEGYDRTRLEFSVYPDDRGNFSTSGALKVGEYIMLLRFVSQDFYIAGYIINNNPQTELTAKLTITPKQLEIVEKTRPLQEIFTKDYDGTNIVNIFDSENNLLFDVLGIVVAQTGEVDAVSITGANYANEYLGQAINVTFSLNGEDSSNYVVEPWIYGVINPVVVTLNFDYKADGSNVTSNVDDNKLQTLSQLAFPFMSTSNLTSNSYSNSTSSTKNFPVSLTGKTGYSFTYWTMNFEGVTSGSQKLALLTRLVSSLGMENFYENQTFSVRVDNTEKTVRFLDALMKDDTDLFGLYYKNNDNIQVTFNANWSTNKYRITLQIADETGKSASLGTVEIDDENPTTENTIVTTNYLGEFDYDSVLILRAFENEHCNFYGFYTSDGKLLDGTEENISISKEGDVNILRILKIRQPYNFVVRYKVQKVNIILDFEGYDDVSMESSDFVDIGNNKYQWSTDFITIKDMTLADLPEILRVGYDIVSLQTSSTTIAKENFATTKISDLLPNSHEQTFSLTLRPNFNAMGVVVTLDYGYDGIKENIAVPFGQAYQNSADWVETPLRNGYTFLGWFNSQNAKVVGSDILTSVEPHTLIAKWEINKYSLQLNSPNSTISDSSIEFIQIGESYIANEVVFGSTVTFKVTAKNGYVISENWENVVNVEINGNEAVVTMTMPAMNLEYDLPILPIQNVVSVAGERIAGFEAYDITDGEEMLEVLGDTVKIATGRKLRLVVSAVSGYYVTENISFDDGFGLIVEKRTENGKLIVEIGGIYKDVNITFTTSESKNNIVLNFENSSHIEVVEVEGVTFTDITNLPNFEANTNSTFVFYVKFVHGYRLDYCETTEFTVNYELVTAGAYRDYFRFEVTDISTSGEIAIYSTLAQFTLTMNVISYDENKDRVEIAGNQAFANGETSIEVDFNTQVNLTTLSENLYSFAGWSKDGIVVFSNESPYVYTVTKNETIYAIFSTLKFEISFSTYNYYTLYSEYNDPTKVQTVYKEISGGRYFDENDREISRLEIYYGSNKTIKYRVPTGYMYYGYGYRNASNEFVYLSINESIEETVNVNISSLLLDENMTDVRLYIVVKAFSVSLNVESKIDIDGFREEDNGVGHLNIQASNGDLVNRYGYIEGTRVHYAADDFVNGELLSHRKFEVVGYTGDLVYLKVQIVKAGYKFLSVVANRQEIEITSLVENENYILFEIGNLIGGTDVDIEVLFKPILNIVDLSFTNNDIKVDGGAFTFNITEENQRKVWTSGREYSSVVVSAYTDSFFEVVALIRAGFTADSFDLQIKDESGLIVQDSLKFEKLSIVDTGYTAKITFKVANYLGKHEISIGIKPSKYVVNLKEETETLVTIKNVSFNQALNLTQYNSENIAIFDDRIQFVNGKLKLDLKQANYNFEGFFTYQNGAGVQYINSNGDAVNAWQESGYVLNTLTSKYQLTDNATINRETGEIEISIYLYWSYLKTRISFEFVPGITTNSTAQDMITGVDYTNSWFYETAPLYIEVSFNTDIHITAPEIKGYKFYKFIISQKNAEGTWLSDVTSFSSDVPWSTNEFDRIVECRVQVVYFAQVEVTTFGGEATYKISQESSDTQAKLLLQEGYVDTSKEFVIEAIEGEGYQFLRWVNTSSGQSFFNKDITLTINKKTNLVMNLQGATVTLNFADYDTTFGQMTTLKTLSRDNSYNSYRLGGYSGDDFIKILYEVDVKVGDKVTFVLSIDYGFSVEWNRKDITFLEYSGNMYHFEMIVSATDAEQMIDIIPTFKDEIVTVYISSSFVEKDIQENTVDSNIVSLAGYVTYNGQKTSFATSAKDEEIRLVTVTNSRYKIAGITINNYDNVFDNMSDFFNEEGVIVLSKEYMQANNIVGNIQILIEYTRMLWEDTILETNVLDGEGTSRNPYLIWNEEDLILVMQFVNSGKFNAQGVRYKDCSFKLMANIDLNEKFWTPIGTSSYAFNGHFNFNEKKISNIYTGYFYKPVNYNGLFGVLGANAVIVENQVSYWYVYLIIGLVSLLIVLLVLLLLLNLRKKKRREELSKK